MTEVEISTVRVGWIGAGRMGGPLVRRLGRAGVTVSVWNRTRGKAERLTADGVKVVDDLVELAGCDAVFTMVSSSADLEEVVRGLLADPERAPGVLVDCSTVSE